MMPRRENPVKTYLSDEEKARLKEWANDAGKSQSHLLREAVLEYLDHDRAARIEGQVRELNQKVDDVLATLDNSGTHTHTGQSDALTKAREIVRRLQRNHDEMMRNDAVVKAIEDYAGIDDRTVRKYKELFRKRGLLFEHPGDRPIWTTETDMWGSWVNKYARLNGGREAAEEVVKPYPAAVHAAIDSDAYRIEITKES
jgi:type I site-specific restriction endonuclease